jgi:hypothetical protein
MLNPARHHFCDNRPSFLWISVLLRIFTNTLRRTDSLPCNKWSRLEAADAFVSNSDNMFFNGIDSRGMSSCNLHVSDSALTIEDHSGVNDRQVKVITTVSVS